MEFLSPDHVKNGWLLITCLQAHITFVVITFQSLIFKMFINTGLQFTIQELQIAMNNNCPLI